MPPSIPPVIADRYRIDARLGSGGMGDVFRAHDRILKRAVALKVLREEDAISEVEGGEEEDTARRKDPFRQLLREARLCAALQHPNIVTIFDVGVSEGIAFIAMELVEGKNLRMSAANPASTPEEKLSWLRDVANALEAAHNVGLVHRDIKPENVIVKKDGNVKVLDFGIAKWASASSRPPGHVTSSATTGPVFAGTPGYMAPEQRMGQIDERSDQYAWGVMAYELLSGTRAPRDRPLTGADIEQAVSPEMVALVERATAYRAEERFPSMRALLEALPSTPPGTRATKPPAVVTPARKPVAETTKTWPPAPNKAKKKFGSTKKGGAKATVFLSATLLTVVGFGIAIAGVGIYRFRHKPAAESQATTSPSSSPSESPSTSASASASPPINAIDDGGLTEEDFAPSSSPSVVSLSPSSAKAPSSPRGAPIFLARVPAYNTGGQRTITMTGFGVGGFSNAQAHRACEKHKEALERCITADPEGAKFFDVIRAYVIYTSTAVFGATTLAWHPREWGGGSHLASCISTELAGRILRAEAGEPEHGWTPTKTTTKNIVGCEISATPKAPTLPLREVASVRIVDAAGGTSTKPWPSHEINGKVSRVELGSHIAKEFLAPEELTRWSGVVGPRMLPCFNLPRGGCNADFALLDFRGSINFISRVRGINRPAPMHEAACAYPNEVVNCVKSAAQSDPIKVKGDLDSQYTIYIYLYP